MQFGEKDIGNQIAPKIKDGEKFYYLGAFNYQFGTDAQEVKHQFQESKKLKLQSLEKQGLTDTDEYRQVKESKLQVLRKDIDRYQKAWNTDMTANVQIASHFT